MAHTQDFLPYTWKFGSHKKRNLKKEFAQKFGQNPEVHASDLKKTNIKTELLELFS